MKVCYTCKQSLDFLNFQTDKSKSDGKKSSCKNCLKLRMLGRPKIIKYETKKCSKCKLDLSLDQFFKNYKSIDGRAYKCKKCSTVAGREYYSKNTIKVKKYHEKSYLQHKDKWKTTRKKWNIENKEIRRATSAKRRAAKLQRTPKWADKEAIKEFYLSCPKGMTVDHIIPLQGKLVSGLHVEYNLQYLSNSENCKKHNRYEV